MTPNLERHFTGSAAVRDGVIGMADGFTVPIAPAAGIPGVHSPARGASAGKGSLPHKRRGEAVAAALARAGAAIRATVGC